MQNIILYFKIHQPFRLKRYRFFDIGKDHYYYDDFANDDIMSHLASISYLPTLKTLRKMVEEYGDWFKCAFSISGTALEQLELNSQDCIDELRALAKTGNVEFLSETFSHGISSLEDPEEFFRQVKLHDDMIRRLFGKTPKVMNNTELIYDDDLATMFASMGFKGAITEGAKHILGWKSPNYVYSAITAPSLKLLLVNDKLSTDISRNFNDHNWSEYPLTADKYIGWISALPAEEQVVNLYFSMDTFGAFLPANTGIFEFLEALPRFAKEKGIRFTTPSEVLKKFDSVGELNVPFPLSGVDESRDVSAWCGNSLQREALDKLYACAERVFLCNDNRLKQDWRYLQSSDHFYYMATKSLDDGKAHASFSPYDSPFSAFTNYMNVLADFRVRVDEQFPTDVENEELNALMLTIRNQAAEIEDLKKEIKLSKENSEPRTEGAEEVLEVVTEEKPKKSSKKKKK